LAEPPRPRSLVCGRAAGTPKRERCCAHGEGSGHTKIARIRCIGAWVIATPAPRPPRDKKTPPPPAAAAALDGFCLRTDEGVGNLSTAGQRAAGAPGGTGGGVRRGGRCTGKSYSPERACLQAPFLLTVRR
jgi:hypothetical protein